LKTESGVFIKPILGARGKKKEFARKKKIPRCDSQLKKEKTLQKMHRVIRYGYA